MRKRRRERWRRPGSGAEPRNLVDRQEDDESRENGSGTESQLNSRVRAETTGLQDSAGVPEYWSIWVSACLSGPDAQPLSDSEAAGSEQTRLGKCRPFPEK